MAVDRDKIIYLYYIEELKIEEIAEKIGVNSGEAVRYHLFKKKPKLEKRDRDWSSGDDYELATLFSKLKGDFGEDFVADAEKLAVSMLHRLSVVKDKLKPIWEAEFQRAVDSKHINGILESANGKESVESEKGSKSETKREEVAIVMGEKSSLELKVCKVRKEAKLPQYATDGSAALDLIACHDVTVSRAGGQAVVHTGLVIKVPDGYAGLVLPRSGLSKNYSVTVLNGPGLIDSDYCGAASGNEDEVMVLLINHSTGSSGKTLDIKAGDRVAQLLLVPAPMVNVVEVDADDEDLSKRPRGGFGSTGK